VRAFWKTLLAAAVGGAATAIAGTNIDPTMSWKQLGASAGIGALVAIVHLFQAKP